MNFQSYFSLLPLLVPWITSFATAFAIAGCSLVMSRPQTPTNKVEVKDVPTQARDLGDIPRKRIMVLPFLDRAASSGDKTAEFARDAFARFLKRTNDFVLVSHRDFPKAVESYVRTNEYDLENMAKVGANIGLAALVEGKVLEIKAKRLSDEVGLLRQLRARIEATIQVRVVNTKNGQIVLNETRSASIEDTTTRFAESSQSDQGLKDDPQLIEGVVVEAFKIMVGRIQQAVDKLGWEGRVALVKGDRIYLNAGRLSGLQIGDILKITEEGEDVFDPESGSLIGKVQGRLKGTVEVVSYFGKDGAIGIVHSGSGFRENDLVELY